jgi:4-amino-4-deoxy-L-arabinose transferase-like glycosyltransferase
LGVNIAIPWTQRHRPAPGDGVSNRASRWWLLAAAAVALLFINLGNRGFNEPDEGRYSNVAMEMLKNPAARWEPRMSDFAHYDKPPLIYWSAAAAMKLFGPTEWAARLPSVLGALMTLVGLGWAAWRLYGEDAAWWAVLFCATLGQFWVLARMLTPDMLLTGFTTLAVGFWAEERHQHAQGRWWWGCVACLALAWWTKATAALVPLLGWFVGLLATRDRVGLRALRPFRLLLLILAAGSPWYLELMQRHPELKGFFLGRELEGRIVGHPDGRRAPFFFHAAFSLVGWMPWWPATLAGLAARRREMAERLRRQRWQALPMEAWIVVIGVTVYSLISSKLVTYTLPFAPWAALLCARWLIGRPAGESRPRLVRRLLGTAAVFSVLYVAVSFALPRWESQLGLSSTLREVGRFLRERHATVAYLDRHMPGMEFYFGEGTYYVVNRAPRQLPSDSGKCEELGEPHFVTAAEFPAHLASHASHAVWLVRYRGRPTSPLAAALPLANERERRRIGDFTLDCVTLKTNVWPLKPPAAQSRRVRAEFHVSTNRE